MTTKAGTVTMYSGDSRRFEITVREEGGNTMDLTDCSIIWGMGTRQPTPYTVVTKATGSGITILDALNGLIEWKLLPADTESLSGDYEHELEVTDTAGDVFTVMTGKIRILQGMV